MLSITGITTLLRGLLTWRNTLRASGLVTMLWLIWTRAHPDPSALLFCGAMIGLPSFVNSEKKDDAS